jgi:hypothetical protein
MTSDTVPSRRLLQLAGVVGFVLGALLVVSFLSQYRIPRGTGVAGADIVLVATPVGELAVTPSGAFVTVRDFSPGDEKAGSFTIANQTNKALSVRVRALPDSKALDGLLQVEVSADGRQLFSGPLGRLKKWTARSTPLPHEGSSRITFRIWFPATTPSGWQGQNESIPLELKATARTSGA